MLSKLARSSTLNLDGEFQREENTVDQAGGFVQALCALKIRNILIKYYIKAKIVKKLHSSFSRDIEVQEGFWALAKYKGKYVLLPRTVCKFPFSPLPLIPG